MLFQWETLYGSLHYDSASDSNQLSWLNNSCIHIGYNILWAHVPQLCEVLPKHLDVFVIKYCFSSPGLKTKHSETVISIFAVLFKDNVFCILICW